jgi:hypothetical protein
MRINHLGSGSSSRFWAGRRSPGRSRRARKSRGGPIASGSLIPAPRDTPVAAALFDELRLNGFIEGQNLVVLPGGFDVSNDAVAERAAALVKAEPDVIIAGPDIPIRVLRGRWRQWLRSVHSDCMGCGIEPRKIRYRRGREFLFARRQHAAPLCEVLSPCRGLRPHHVQRDRIGTWEVSGLAVAVACSKPSTAVRIGKVRNRSR